MMPVLRDTAGSESMSSRHMCSIKVSAMAACICWECMMEEPLSFGLDMTGSVSAGNDLRRQWKEHHKLESTWIRWAFTAFYFKLGAYTCMTEKSKRLYWLKRGTIMTFVFYLNMHTFKTCVTILQLFIAESKQAWSNCNNFTDGTFSVQLKQMIDLFWWRMKMFHTYKFKEFF